EQRIGVEVEGGRLPCVQTDRPGRPDGVTVSVPKGERRGTWTRWKPGLQGGRYDIDAQGLIDCQPHQAETWPGRRSWGRATLYLGDQRRRWQNHCRSHDR